MCAPIQSPRPAIAALIASIGTLAQLNTAWNIRNSTRREQHEAPHRMHHDRVDAVLEALHAAPPSRRDERRGCGAPRLQLGRPSAARRHAGSAAAAGSTSPSWRSQQRAAGPAWPSRLHRHGLDDRAAELARRGARRRSRCRAARDVGHVQRDHHRPAEPRELQHEAQVQAQVGGVDHARRSRRARPRRGAGPRSPRA